MRRAAVVIWFVLGSILAACSFTPGGGLDAAGGADDAAPIDAAADDGGLDAPALDARGDAALDGAVDALDAAALDGAVDAALDAAVDAALDAPPCVAGCDGADLVTCPGGPTGPPTRTACDLGCIAIPTAHCGRLVPSNLTSVQTATILAAVSAGVAFGPNEDYLLDTDSGEISFTDGMGNDQVFRAAGDAVAGTRYDTTSPTTAIFAVETLTLPASSNLYAFGNRGVIFLARSNVSIAGTIDFTPGCVIGGEGYTLRCAGPGGGDGGRAGATAATGCAPGASGSSSGNDSGGAGGGFATIGGNGGAGGVTAMAATLGACGGDTLIPLRGGGGGGAGGPNGGAWGGGGGGAIQITSLATVTIQAVSAVDRARLNVGGAGGKGTLTTNRGGGGGGAGGGLLIEGRTVVLGQADLLAGGGGGGGGRIASDPAMFTTRDGDSAQLDGLVALGGDGDGSSGDLGRGGNGALPTVMAQVGAGGVDGTGGGGGGIGRVRINTKDPTFPLPGSARAIGVYTSGPVARE